MTPLVLLLGAAAATATAPAGMTLTFSENVAVAFFLPLAQPTKVVLSAAYQWTGVDWDHAGFFYAVNHDDAAAFLLPVAISQANTEADVRVMRYDANVAPLFAEQLQPGLRVLTFDQLWPGNWSLLLFQGVSSPITEIIYNLETEPPVAPLVAVGDSVAFVTLRDFDAGTHAFYRGLGGGASMAFGAGRSLAFSEHVYGFSYYLPGEADVHAFSVQGPGVGGPADEVVFIDESPGNYEFTLDAVSAGGWPGRVWILLAGLDLPWD